MYIFIAVPSKESLAADKVQEFTGCYAIKYHAWLHIREHQQCSNNDTSDGEILITQLPLSTAAT